MAARFLVERKGRGSFRPLVRGRSDGPTGRLMRQIVDAFAEYERAPIRSRTRAALQAKRSRGERAGHVPYGFQVADDGRTLARHDDEQATLTLLRRLRADGYTLAGIAAALNQRGVRARRNGPWSHQFVCQLLMGHPTEIA